MFQWPTCQQTSRLLPNILITGSPGTGKSSLCQQLVESLNQRLQQHGGKFPQGTLFEHVPVSQVALEHNFAESESTSEKCGNESTNEECGNESTNEECGNESAMVLNEDPLLDYMEDVKKVDTRGAYIVEYHASELFPERWFDLVVVLRCEPTVLSKRLAKRNYSDKKVMENLECEMWNVCAEEAFAGFNKALVLEMHSANLQQMEANHDQLVAMVEHWCKLKGL